MTNHNNENRGSKPGCLLSFFFSLENSLVFVVVEFVCDHYLIFMIADVVVATAAATTIRCLNDCQHLVVRVVKFVSFQVQCYSPFLSFLSFFFSLPLSCWFASV